MTLLAVLLLASQGAQAAANNPAPTYKTVGRFVHNPDKSVTCEWPGSAIYAKVKATKLVANFVASTENERWQIEVDGKATGVLKLPKGESIFTIPCDSTKPHRILLVKRTEAFAGRTTFRGFSGSGIEYVDPDPLNGDFRLLVIGDSISAGFGVDGKTKEEPFSHDTSNAYLTYGWETARRFGGLATIIAWSGKKMWPDNTIPEIFDYTFPGDKTQPLGDGHFQAIVINLATNDFGKGIPDRDGWIKGYKAFLSELRIAHPKTPIFLATGSMMSDSWPPKEKHLSTVKSWLDAIVADSNDTNLHRVDFATQLESDGIGSSWHPNAVTQRKMADVLTEAISKVLDPSYVKSRRDAGKRIYGN